MRAAACYRVINYSLFVIEVEKTASRPLVRSASVVAVLNEEVRVKLTEEIKNRRCARCKQDKPEYEFCKTPSNFFPGHRSIICTSCLEKMVRQDVLGEVDRLCRYLDIPFDINKWTQLYKIH